MNEYGIISQVCRKRSCEMSLWQCSFSTNLINLLYTLYSLPQLWINSLWRSHWWWIAESLGLGEEVFMTMWLSCSYCCASFTSCWGNSEKRKGGWKGGGVETAYVNRSERFTIFAAPSLHKNAESCQWCVCSPSFISCGEIKIKMNKSRLFSVNECVRGIAGIYKVNCTAQRRVCGASWHHRPTALQLRTARRERVRTGGEATSAGCTRKLRQREICPEAVQTEWNGQSPPRAEPTEFLVDVAHSAVS